jgi:large conductance mechanosensitive channel
MISKFRSMMTKSNAFALAIGVIIGGATGKVVSSLVDDVLMPPIGLVLPKGDWREAQVVLSSGTDANGKVTVNAIKYGHFVGALVDFTAISIVVYFLGRAVLPKEPDPPSTKTCSECLETIPSAAKRCKACASVVNV